MPAWEQRFRAPSITFPQWADGAPGRLVFASSRDGAWQVFAHDLATGARRRVTDAAIGVLEGAITPDGASVAWFDDTTGDEVGRWMVEPFEGGAPARPLVPGMPDAWSCGLAMREAVVALGLGEADGFRVMVSVDGEEPRELYRHEDLLEVTGLSRDGHLVCFQHAEHGDNIHLALRVLDVRTGAVVGEQWDGEGLGLRAVRWSPVRGDLRLAIVHERESRERPAIWDVGSGERREAELDLPGDVHALDWWPDGSALLIQHDHDGRSELYRLPADTLTDPQRVPHAVGSLTGAGVRPDGEVWYRVSSGAVPWSVRGAGPANDDEDGREVLSAEGEPPAAGRPFVSWSFENPKGQRIHGFYVTPPGPGPHPTVMRVHGGPTWAYADEFMPSVQALVDHGYAVGIVNYRGSTGYGTEFRDRLIGDPGFPEVEDVAAGADDLVVRGVADPERLVVGGASWGGYVTLMALGLRPDRWICGVAEVPVGDYPVAYADEAPVLQAFDRSLFGGSPEELPDLYRERSPLTYVDRVAAPVLVTAGDNDSRCPIRQVLNYVEALRERGGRVELYRFEAGHGSMVLDERVKQTRLVLDFLAEHVPGVGSQPQ